MRRNKRSEGSGIAHMFSPRVRGSFVKTIKNERTLSERGKRSNKMWGSLVDQNTQRFPALASETDLEKYFQTIEFPCLEDNVIDDRVMTELFGELSDSPLKKQPATDSVYESFEVVKLNNNGSMRFSKLMTGSSSKKQNGTNESCRVTEARTKLNPARQVIRDNISKIPTLVFKIKNIVSQEIHEEKTRQAIDWHLAKVLELLMPKE